MVDSFPVLVVHIAVLADVVLLCDVVAALLAVFPVAT